MEIWKDIPDYEGYQASNCGRIRTFNKVTYSKRHGERHWKNRILKIQWNKSTSRESRRDAKVGLYKNGVEKKMLVARLVCYAFYGVSDLTVDHIDGDTYNNNLSNLQYLTREENIKQGFKNGLYKTKKIILTKNNEKYSFNSLSEASIFLNKYKGYVSYALKNNKKIINSKGEEFYKL